MYEIELCLLKINKSGFSMDYLRELLPDNLSLVDKSDRGWGYTISFLDDRTFEDIDSSILDIIKCTEDIHMTIKDFSPLILIACYSKTVTTTIKIECIKEIAKLNADIEVCIYPVDE